MQWLTDNWSGVLGIVTAAIALASAIANLTPNDSDNKIVAALAKIVDVLALNLKKKGR